MNMADPDPAPLMPAEASNGPLQISFDDFALQDSPGDVASPAEPDGKDLARPKGCPFLLADGGGWRLDVPAREHRCAAVSPPAALSFEKQSRLCLTESHPGCATYVASMSARGTRLGTSAASRTTRWGIARTTTVVQDAGGMRARLTSLLLDRRRWPAIPAVILVTTLLVLAFSGLRGGGATPVATTIPTSPAASAPYSSAGSARPLPSGVPSAASSSAPTAGPSNGPSAAPSASPRASAVPAASFRTYKVKSGDTLSGIASDFGTTSRAIAELNGITTSTTLHIGQILRIPNPTAP